MAQPALLELAMLFALCVAAGVLFQWLRMPPIVGFLCIGAIVGPHAIGLVKQPDMVRELAEVGVVVLLFALGMEVPLQQLARLRRPIFVGGGIQIVGTVAVVATVCALCGTTWSQGVFLGFLLSMSSTAAVTKLLVDGGEFAAPHGRLAIAIAVAQDIAVVPMLLLVPTLNGTGTQGGVLKSLENLALLVVLVGAARLVVPRVLALVSRTRSRELFVLTLATICLLLAVATANLGLSLALGAFLAGILIADTEFHGHAVAEVEPFRDALASLFFVSIGMLFDPHAIVEAPGIVAVALLAVLAGKAVVVALAARALGAPGWVRLRTGLLLAQVGEFSFVLVQIGKDLLPERGERIFMVVAVLSIASTPLLNAFGRALVTRARAKNKDSGPVRVGDAQLEGHAIIVGFGPTGRGVLQALRVLGLPVIAIEANAQTVKQERAKGTPIEFGDATRVAVLKSLGIERARILVLAINDTAAAQRIAKVARQFAPQVHVLARSVYTGEVQDLRAAGAHEVVPQELEATVEILVRALRRFLVPDDEIGRRIHAVRSEAHGSDKQAPVGRLEPARIAEYVPGLGVGVHRAAPGSQAAGRTIGQLALRKATGCSLVAIRRGPANLTALELDTRIEAGDVVVVIGPEERLADAAAAFQSPATDANTAAASGAERS